MRLRVTILSVCLATFYIFCFQYAESASRKDESATVKIELFQLFAAPIKARLHVICFPS